MSKETKKGEKRTTQIDRLGQDILPAFKLDVFLCPFCRTHTQQQWRYFSSGTSLGGASEDTQTWLAKCIRCENYSVWHKEEMVYPFEGSAPLPHPDLPDEIKEDYEEARTIVSRSPKSAAALLRLAIEKLMNIILKEELLEENKKEDLNDKIKLMVQKGLSPDIQQAFDIVRIIGNKSVHPGQIDLNDNPEMANKLFELVNIIARQTIAEPKAIRGFYDKLPEAEKNRIEKRNGNKSI